jgi:hypothetical protein
MHTVVAPDKSNKKEYAGTIRQRLGLGTVHFGAATIRAVLEAESTHDNTACATPRKQKPAKKQKDEAKQAFVLVLGCSKRITDPSEGHIYPNSLRRAMPANPTNPEPKSISVPGSGT